MDGHRMQTGCLGTRLAQWCCALSKHVEATIMAPWLVPEVSVAEMLELNTFGPGGWHLSR